MNAAATEPAHGRPRVGVSRCLLGHEVRHDGGHKRDRYLTDVLGEHVEWVSVCPEVEVGMDTPRPALRLVRGEAEVRMVVIKTDEDWTERMNAYSEGRIDQLAENPIDGFVLKRNSPSCGMTRVKVYDDDGAPGRDGSGLFATKLMRRFPLLPVEEEGRLHDPCRRENFVTRVFAYNRWHAFLRAGPTPARFTEFHAAHRLLLLAHAPKLYYELGPRGDRAAAPDFDGLLQEYETTLMQALARPAPVKRHVNVLQHLRGLLKNEFDSTANRELFDVIDSFRARLVPLVAPLTLFNQHLRKIDHPWVGQQRYLDPYPLELALRSVV